MAMKDEHHTSTRKDASSLFTSIASDVFQMIPGTIDKSGIPTIVT